MGAPDLSIIIPVYNEERVLKPTLDALRSASLGFNAEVIVACNGCRDESYSIASNHPVCTRVLDLPQASKTFALNEAERYATAFPRLFLDADIEIRSRCIATIVTAAANAPEVLFIGLGSETDLSHSSALVRAYYQFWLSLPYVGRKCVGSGAYVLTQMGRSRFQQYPEVIADDEFVRRHFLPNEMNFLQEKLVLVRAPRNLHNLTAVRVRGRQGAYQLNEMFPELAPPKSNRRMLEALSHQLKNPRLWFSGLVYAALSVMVRIKARRAYDGLSSSWVRDESSR